MLNRYLAELQLLVSTALFAADPVRIRRARNAVQNARTMTIERFNRSTNEQTRRECLALTQQLQTLADRCRTH
jgi:HD superfamily phosphohydrolase YqeK